MRYRKLGSSDLEVSEIALGAWLTYAGGIEFDQTRACTDAAYAPAVERLEHALAAAERAAGVNAAGPPGADHAHG